MSQATDKVVALDEWAEKVRASQQRVEWAKDLANGNGRKPKPKPEPSHDSPPPAATYTPELTAVHETFRQWLGPSYDLGALHAGLAVVASYLFLQGDPPWLQIVGGSGSGKTELLAALAGQQEDRENLRGELVSTIRSDAALLSGSPARERAKDATGGLLRRIGSDGLLIVKDFTSILSMGRDPRNQLLGALREVHDGVYSREVGADGGRVLRWTGRIVWLSGVTSAYDEHHGVIAKFGDRFLLLRLSGGDSDEEEARQAVLNTGNEQALRVALRDAVDGLLASVRTPVNIPIPEPVVSELVFLASVVARARSSVARDARGTPEWAHDRERATRVAKELTQIYRGSRAVGLDDEQAVRLLRRIAKDSIPPNRRACLLAVSDGYATKPAITRHLAGLIGSTTVDNTLKELAMHGLLDCDMDSSPWIYRLAPAFKGLSIIRETSESLS